MKRTTVVQVLRAIVLIVFGLVLWSLAGTAAVQPGSRVLMFVVAAAAILMAARPWIGAGLVVVGIMTLPMSSTILDRLDAWSLAFALCLSLGPYLLMRRFPGIRWIVASIPFWALSNAAGWMTYIALGLVFTGLIMGGVGPVLPGRRRKSDRPVLPELANGPLVPVEPCEYPGGRPSRVLEIAAMVLALMALGLIVLALAGWGTPLTGILAFPSALMAGVFKFGNWWAGRIGYRVDAVGLHSRLFFTEHTIRWSDVVDVSLRYVLLYYGGMRIVYYCVHSPTRECAFPSSMPQARDLQATIEAATGFHWPAPRITATL